MRSLILAASAAVILVVSGIPASAGDCGWKKPSYRYAKPAWTCPPPRAAYVAPPVYRPAPPPCVRCAPAQYTPPPAPPCNNCGGGAQQAAFVPPPATCGPGFVMGQRNGKPWCNHEF